MTDKTTPSRPEFLFLQQENLIQCGLLDMRKALEDVERVFLMMGRGEIRQPTKTRIEFLDDTTSSVRLYEVVSMPVFIGGAYQRGGVKWAAESIDNAHRGDLPYGIDMLILHDLKRAHPVCIMDCTLITAMRTGAATGVAAKYLARPDSRVAGLVGAGVIGRTALEALGLSVPGLRKFRVFDLKAERVQKLQHDFSDRWEIEAAPSVQAAVEGADVVATVTTTRKPFVRAEWLAEGVFYSAIGSNEAENRAYAEADRLVADEWNAMQHYGATNNLVKMAHANELKTKVVSLWDVMLGHATGRTGPQERVQFHSMGMGSEDMMVAERLYHEAQRLGLGRKLTLWNSTDLG